MHAEDIGTVLVVGAGTMGAGIAGEMARVGCQVHLLDVTEKLVEAGLGRLQAGYRALVEAGLLTAAEAEAARARVRPEHSLEEAGAVADLVVEAAREDLALKEELFARLDAVCPPAAVLTTNTSGLSISRMAARTGRPALVAGLHFWNPPHIIPLVEVTRGEQTAAQTSDLLVGLVRRLGKQPVLVRHDVPGFVGNRLQFAVLREALHLLETGVASAEDIDAAMTAGPGLRYGLLGPLRTADLGGLDVFRAISGYLFAQLSAASQPSPVLDKLVEQGRLGAKSGSGFYEYGQEERERLLARRDRVLLRFLAARRQD
jgi:3-hydroxybutyryl-CoA dehydrogenase